MTVTEDLWSLRLDYLAAVADMSRAQLAAERHHLLSITDSSNVAERLALVRAELARRTWHRDRNGTYACGPYRVGRTQTGEWWAEGPGVDRVFDTKAQAQAACCQAERVRATAA